MLISMLIFAVVVPYGFGRFSGVVDTSMDLTGATHAFLSTAVEQLDAGNADRVHSELRELFERTGQTYEASSFSGTVHAASERLKLGP